MSDPTPRPGKTHHRAAAAALCLLGLAAAPASAGSWPEEPGSPGRRARHAVRALPTPALPPAAIVSGYLPRNNNVPMYNEPPRVRSPGRPAW